MDSQGYNMVVLGQIFKHISAKLIEKLKNKYKNYPCLSGSNTEFCRRWHISLSTWFKPEINKFQPDVVILETGERFLDRLLLIKETSEARMPVSPE